MEIIPAIDLLDGKVVRLQRGDYDLKTNYSDDAVSVAKEFVSAGARWIHMVDLNAAKTGRPTNTEVIKKVRQQVDVKIELGGGARSNSTIASMLDMGIDRVIVGSAALKDWAWFENLIEKESFAGKIALGLDARSGKLATQGWTRQSETPATEIARRVKGSQLAAIIYTDIARDGMLSGVNIEATAELINSTDVPIIASGGVSCIEDIKECKRIDCWGAIIGRAYYEGKIDIAQAVKVAS